MIVATANETRQLAGANSRRQSIRIQNKGPGQAYVQSFWFDDVGQAELIPVNGVYVDEPPGPVWQGEWYIRVDAANTDVTVGES